MLHVLVVPHHADAGGPEPATDRESKGSAEATAPETVLKALTIVSNPPKLLTHPIRFPGLLKALQLTRRAVVFCQSRVSHFGSEHARLHGQVDSFEALRIEEPPSIANDQSSICRGGW